MDGKILLSLLIDLLNSVVWPATIIITILVYKDEMKAMLSRFSSADDLKMSIGSLTIEAKAMREIHDSIATAFQDEALSKAKVKALIDTKIRSVQAAMEHKVTQSNIRTGARQIAKEKITITGNDGNILEGETLDISDAGIGFTTNGRLQFHEIVKIKPTVSNKSIPMLDEFVIVRIEQSDEGYYYGAVVPDVK